MIFILQIFTMPNSDFFLGGGGAAVAKWIRQHLPSCRPRLESQAHQIRFNKFKFELWQINRKSGQDLPIF